MKTLCYVLFFSLLFASNSSAQFYTIRRGQAISSSFSTPILPKEEDAVKSPELIAKAEHKKEEVKDRFIPNKFHNPLDEPLYITSPYGYRVDPFTGKKRFHGGIDLRCDNDKVYSMLYGKVKKVASGKRGLGNYVVISHGNFEVTYGHLQYALVENGDNVRPGDIVAVSGNTGRSTGPHLHIELKYRGKRSDPLPLLAFVDKTYNLQTKLHKVMEQNNSYLTALEHVQADYADDYSEWLKERSLSASEETALLYLAEVEEALNSSTELPL